MKKLLLFVTMAASLLFTQCKKEDSVSSAGKTVSMTVTAGPGSKTDIASTGAITWSMGDKLYVGDGSKYIGYLTLKSGAGSATGVFTGNVTLTGITEGTEKEFGFFYLGSKNYTEGDDALKKGESTSVEVKFDSQTGLLGNLGSCHVGYGSATGTVVGNVVTDINVTMLSKVAIAHFDIKKEGVAYSAQLTLSGDNIYNKMTVNFNSTGFDCTGTVGEISLTNTTSSEKYVMLVPTSETTGKQTLTFTGVDDNVSGSYTLANGIEANKFYGLTGAIEVTLEAAAPAHEYVDLGLSVKWATCNVGASKPEDSGWYFMWGSTTNGGDSNCSWENCPGNGGNSSYNATAIAEWDGSNLIDGVLNSDVDAARVNWGGDWRMPTTEEWKELYDNTTSAWTDSYNGTGVKGRVFTSKNNGKTLFLPAAGRRDGSYVSDAGSYGYYWSSSLYSADPSYAYFMRFNSGGVDPQHRRYRCDGVSVRPVQ